MVTVKNLTASPYDLETTTGYARLPAFGEITRPTKDEPGEFKGDYLQLLESSMAVKVTDAPSEPAQGDDLAKLRADYAEIVGKKPYHGWDAAELQAKIDEALAS